MRALVCMATIAGIIASSAFAQDGASLKGEIVKLG
jgi:hypothetical protein